jgi:hypothetical protein
LKAAGDLIDESELSPEDKATLTKSVSDLAKSGPDVEVASLRFKRLAAKAGKAVSDGLYRIAVDVASEAAKKALGL